jgi:RNA polymerase sigma factor (TIGR02999 family)
MSIDGPAGDAVVLRDIYEQLRAIARHRIANEAPGHTLQATALVHEVWLKLSSTGGLGSVLDRRQFVFLAAEAMRRVLIDHARSRNRLKRGGGQARRTLADVADLAACENPQEIVDLDAAIHRFEQEHEQAAKVVKLRFFVGLSIPETAEAMGISESAVKRDWTFARAWLHRALS